MGGALLGILGVSLALGGSAVAAALLCAASSVVLLAASRRLTRDYASAPVLFSAFFVLYGLSGPISVLAGQSLSNVFPESLLAGPFLEVHGFASAGLCLGMALGSHLMPPQAYTPHVHAPSARWFTVSAAFVGVLATGFELVNVTRMGGFGPLWQGKAAFQSAYSDLVLTLPSDEFALLAIALAALAGGLSARERNRGFAKSVRNAVPLVLLLSPIIFRAAVLGQRGLFVSWLLVLFVGTHFVRPLRRLTKGILLGLLAAYLLMGAIYTMRSPIQDLVLTGDWRSFIRTTSRADRLLAALNPAQNEFGAPFGNFSTYVSSGDHALQLGRTYFVGLADPWPAFLYPGTKPKQISIDFRDTYFPQEALYGAIAGTGFSAILEAFMNFGRVGVLIVFFAVGTTLVALEAKKRQCRSWYFALFYCMLAPSLQSFHRSSFGFSVIGTVVVAALGVAFVFTVRSLSLHGDAVAASVGQADVKPFQSGEGP
jgi:hypothetical protein